MRNHVPGPEGEPFAFETFVRDLAELKDGDETALVLRDLAPGRRKYFARHVVAVVTRARDPSAVSNRLRVRSMVGNEFPGEWYVTVLRELPSRLPGRPYTNAFEALDRTWAEEARVR